MAAPWRWRLLLFAGVLAVSLAALESWGRFLGGAPAAEETSWMAPNADLGWTIRAGFSGRAFDAARRYSADGFPDQEGAPQRRPGRPLLLVLGDSRTFGNGVESDQTFAAVLARQTPGFAVGNGGVPGYSAYQGLRRLEKDLDRLRPRLVVFAFGFNDRRYVLGDDDADSPERFARLVSWRAGAVWMMKSAFFRALAARRSARLTPLDLGGVRIRVPVEDYRDDLRRAARLCRTRGAAFWILSLGDNPALSGDLDRAEEAATAGDRAAARQALAVAVEANNAFSDAARLRLAALYAEAGESARAAATRHSPRVLVSLAGGYPIASQRAYRAAAVDVARDEGVELIDGGTILAALPERYLDFCHFDAEGHRLIGEALARRLERTALAARGVALPAAAVR